MLRDTDWLTPNSVFSRLKVCRRGREFPIVVAAYRIADVCKASGKMLLARKWNEMKNRFTSLSSKKARQLPETQLKHAFKKPNTGLGLKGSFLLKVNFSLS